MTEQVLQIAKPSNEDEFRSMMETVNKWLSANGVQIFARPMRAIFEVSKALDLRLNIAPANDSPPRPGVYGGDDLAHRIHNWYADRYGPRLLISFGPGKGAIEVKGDLYEVRFPRAWGLVNFFIEKDIKSSDPWEDLKYNRIPQHNVLDSFEGLTQAMRQSLTREEAKKILFDFVAQFGAMEAIYSDPDMPMAEEIKSDISTAVERLVSNAPHYGQSKYASLQAAEKAMKSKLRAGGEEFKRNHNLDELAYDLQRTLGITLSPSDIAKASCSAGPRYGEIKVSRQEAYEAYRAALRICEHCSTRPTAFAVTSNPYPPD
jgi:HEPN domain-containing protein